MTARRPLVIVNGQTQELPVGDCIEGCPQARDTLIEDRIYYVSPAGSDFNTGSVDAPFLTIQHAINVVSLLDLAGHSVTIKLQDGLYSVSSVIIPRLVGDGSVTICGSTPIPNNVIVSVTGMGFFIDGVSVPITIKNVRIIGSASATSLVRCVNSGVVYIDNVDFGSISNGNHIEAADGGHVVVGDGVNYAISGGARHHLYANRLGRISLLGNGTITLFNTPKFTSFVGCYRLGYVQCTNKAFSGEAIGKKYKGKFNSVIFTNGGADDYFPGHNDGSTDSGAIYS